MYFSSHSLVSHAAVQALAYVAGSSLTPAVHELVEKNPGLGSDIHSDAFSIAYDALGQWSQPGNLEESWAGHRDDLVGKVEPVAAIAVQALAPFLPMERADGDLLHRVEEVHDQFASLVQPGGDQADLLTGGVWEKLDQGLTEVQQQPLPRGSAKRAVMIPQAELLLGEPLTEAMSLTAGGLKGQGEPISVMRLWPDGEASPRQSDLQVSHVGVTSAIAPGEKLTVEAQFHNAGNQAAGSSTIRYWLSDDLLLDSTDQALGSHRLEALAPDSQARQVVSFEHQPTWKGGAKYVLVEADGDHALAEHNESNNLSHAPVTLDAGDLQQYWFYYNFNPANPESADSYIGSVIAPEGTYAIAPSLASGGHDPAYGFNPTAQLTEANTDGKYLVYGKSDYDDALVVDQGKVFVLSYTDRDGSSATRFTPNQYAQAGKPSGLNFLGSESDYLDNAQTVASRFGQDYYEADTGNPALDIQAFTPFGHFSPAQRNAIETAISNWEQLIVRDKDDSGVLKLAFTRTAQRINSSKWGWVWGEAYIDKVVRERVDRDFPAVDIGGDFHNRVNYNSIKLEQLSSNQLLRLTMHEIGHTLGLDEAQEDELLGLNSVMDKHGLDPHVTEGVFQRLESLGYEVNRAAANTLQWN